MKMDRLDTTEKTVMRLAMMVITRKRVERRLIVVFRVWGWMESKVPTLYSGMMLPTFTLL